MTNKQIAEALDVSPGIICRIRSRSRFVKCHWKAIDAWRVENPNADVRYPLFRTVKV